MRETETAVSMLRGIHSYTCRLFAHKIMETQKQLEAGELSTV
jgi:hypothetical protein